MSFNDLVTFATGVRFRIDTTEMIVTDAKLASRIGASAGDRWLAVRGFRYTNDGEPPVCWTEVYINAEFAAIGRLLPRHTGPIFPLIEDLFGQSVVGVHQQIAAGLIPPGWRKDSRCKRERRRWKYSAPTDWLTAESRRLPSTPVRHPDFVIR